MTVYTSPDRSRTLWFDPEQTRFFLVPDGQELLSGDLIIRAVTGRQKEVDPTGLVSFEVTRDEANAWLNSQPGQSLGRARRAVNSYFTGKHSSGQVPPTDEADPGVRLFSALTGESTEAIQSDPQATLRGLRTLGGNMSGLVRSYLSADPSDREAARQRMRELRETLRAHGIGRREPESAGVPEVEASPPKADGPAVSETPSDEATGPTPDPGEVFRARLREILEGVVARLEDLADKVLPGGENKEPFSD